MNKIDILKMIKEEIKKERNKPINIQFEKCREDAKTPFYAREGDAGMDISSAEDIIIKPGETKTIPTGIIMAIEEGYEVQIRPRSGLSLNTPLRVVNSPATIDSGFRGELQIVMQNTSYLMPYEIEDETPEMFSSQTKRNAYLYFHTFEENYGNRVKFDINIKPYLISEKGNKNGVYEIKKGDRIAQIVLNKHEVMNMVEVEQDFVRKMKTSRGEGGLGHSGTK